MFVPSIQSLTRTLSRSPSARQITEMQITQRTDRLSALHGFNFPLPRSKFSSVSRGNQLAPRTDIVDSRICGALPERGEPGRRNQAGEFGGVCIQFRCRRRQCPEHGQNQGDGFHRASNARARGEYKRAGRRCQPMDLRWLELRAQRWGKHAGKGGHRSVLVLARNFQFNHHAGDGVQKQDRENAAGIGNFVAHFQPNR